MPAESTSFKKRSNDKIASAGKLNGAKAKVNREPAIRLRIYFSIILGLGKSITVSL